MAASDAPSARTTVKRHPERAAYDRETIDAILDEALVGHLGFVVDGSPFVMPTMYARRGDRVFLHGAVASRMLRAARDGEGVCFTVTLLDGIVLARAVFTHSMNYRSVVIVGRPVEVVGRAEKLAAMEALVEHVCRGRWPDARWPTGKELGATTILALDLTEASAKVRAGGPKDVEEDVAGWGSVWAGHVPIQLTALPPLPSPDLAPGIPVPEYAREYRRP
jgi:uncharacterized protein